MATQKNYKKIIREHIQDFVDKLLNEREFNEIETKHIKNTLMPSIIDELTDSYKQKKDYYENYYEAPIQGDVVFEEYEMDKNVEIVKPPFDFNFDEYLSENNLMKYKSYVNLMSYSKDKKNITQQWQPPKHITEKITSHNIDGNIEKLKDKYRKIPNGYWSRVKSLVETFNQKNSEIGIFIANTEKNDMVVEKITADIPLLDKEKFSKETTKVINSLKDNTLDGIQLMLLDKHQSELQSELMSILRVYFKYTEDKNYQDFFNVIQQNLNFRLENPIDIKDFVDEFMNLTDEERKPSVKDYDVFNKSLLINRYEFYTFAYLKNLNTLDSFLGKTLKDEQDKISIVFIRPQLLNVLNNFYFTINKLPEEHIYADRIKDLSKKVNKLIETLELLPYTTKDLKNFLAKNPNFITNLQLQVQDLNRIDNLHIKTLLNDEFTNNLPNVKDLLDKSLMSVFTMYGDNNDFLEAFSGKIATNEDELHKKLLNKRVEISLLEKLGIPFNAKDETISQKNGISTICLNKDLLAIVETAITNNIDINEKHLFVSKPSVKTKAKEFINDNTSKVMDEKSITDGKNIPQPPIYDENLLNFMDTFDIPINEDDFIPQFIDNDEGNNIPIEIFDGYFDSAIETMDTDPIISETDIQQYDYFQNNGIDVDKMSSAAYRDMCDRLAR